MAPISSRVARGSAWLATSRLTVNSLGFISTIVMARLLAPEDFGLVALATSMMAMVSAVTDMQFSQALIHHQAPTKEHLDTAWTLGILRGMLIGAGFCAVGPLVAAFYEDSRLANIMYAFGFSLLLNGLANPRRVLLQRKLIFWQDFTLLVSQKFIGVAAGIAFAMVYPSYWSLVVGIIVGQLALVLVSYTVMPFRPRIGFSHARELWSFSLWLMLGQLVTVINWRFEQLVVGKILGLSILGQYSVGDNLAQIPTRETTAPLITPLFPAFANLRDSPERLRNGYQRAQTLITAIALPLGFGFAAIAQPLIDVVMGQRWQTAIIVVQVLSVVFSLQTIGAQVKSLALALGVTKKLFHRDVQVFLVYIPLTIIGVYFAGIVGALIARAAIGILTMVVNMMLVRNLIDLSVSRQIFANARSLLSAGIMWGALLFFSANYPTYFSSMDLVVKSIIMVSFGMIIYTAIMTILWMSAGKPSGPETEVIAVARKIGRKFSAKS